MPHDATGLQQFVKQGKIVHMSRNSRWQVRPTEPQWSRVLPSARDRRSDMVLWTGGIGPGRGTCEMNAETPRCFSLCSRQESQAPVTVTKIPFPPLLWAVTIYFGLGFMVPSINRDSSAWITGSSISAWSWRPDRSSTCSKNRQELETVNVSERCRFTNETVPTRSAEGWRVAIAIAEGGISPFQINKRLRETT